MYTSMTILISFSSCYEQIFTYTTYVAYWNHRLFTAVSTVSKFPLTGYQPHTLIITIFSTVWYSIPSIECEK